MDYQWISLLHQWISRLEWFVALFEVTGELVCWLLLCFVANGSANWISAPWRLLHGGGGSWPSCFNRTIDILGYYRILSYLLSESLGLY